MSTEQFEGLPDRSRDLTGVDDRGDDVRLIRGVSQKLYRCGCCKDAIEPGDDHIIVQYSFRKGGSEHSHWHRRCALEVLRPQLRGLRVAGTNRAGRRRGGRRRAR